MARRCVICSKHTVTGFNVSHSKRHTKREWLPNLQRVRIILNGRPQRAYVCVKCLKGGKVTRAATA